MHLPLKLESTKSNLDMKEKKVEKKKGLKETKNTHLLFQIKFCSQNVFRSSKHFYRFFQRKT